MQNEDEDDDITRTARHYIELREEAVEARHGGMAEFGRAAFLAAVHREDQRELEKLEGSTGFVITSTPEEQ